MSVAGALANGRAAFAREAWSDACRHLAAADREAPLEPEDLERLATAAYLVGDDRTRSDALTRAHNAFLAKGDARRAARSAFWLAFSLIDRPSQRAQAGGWLARAARVLDEATTGECAERGFLLCSAGFQQVVSGDASSAQRSFEHAASIGIQFHEPDLTALARHGVGRSLLRMNKAQDGFAILDEVMVSITCGEVGPIVAGLVYCSVISSCAERFELSRAQEWTAALANWCAAHPDMVPFRGACLIRRSELMQLHGQWQEALEEAERACARLENPPGQLEYGAALYQRAELHRLMGQSERADEGYRRASHEGLKPEPGTALLRVAQGQVEVADAAIRRALEELRGPRTRVHVLRAAVDVFLGARDVAAARLAADELAQIATETHTPFLQAASAQASGAVSLASGHPQDAAHVLRDACALWREVDAPYEIAQVRATLGLAYRQLGDEEGAQMEFDAAQETFERLQAAPAAAHVAVLRAAVTTAGGSSAGLTGREVEVLRLVASGKTNKAIAADLAISEKTVARHISNIFLKLDLANRSAATAYAYEHKLL